MANIKEKDINDLSDWNAKELRKLKINIKNRLQSFSGFSKPKELQASHILFDVGEHELKNLLVEIGRAEKKLRES